MAAVPTHMDFNLIKSLKLSGIRLFIIWLGGVERGKGSVSQINPC